MSTQVSIVNRNPTFSPYAVDSPPDSVSTAYSRGHDNRAYENSFPEHKTDPSSHTYAELPGLQNGNSRRRVANPIYDSADPYTGHSTKYQEEPVQPYKESKLGCVLLFVILLISIAALVLVVMIILGKLGPACSCENTGSPSTSKLQETQSNVNLDKITEALNSLKKNLSEVETKLNKKIADLQNELNDAKNQIQTLQRDNNAELWRQSNETRDKLNVHEKTHDTKYEQMTKTINDTVDKCRDTCSNRNLTQRLQSLENEQQNDVNRLQKNINDSNNKCMTVNNTLTVKINEVSKMEGPMGPRGYNGSQGIQGPKGDKGDTGATGAAGLNGTKGDKGDTGVKGDKGDKGDTGAKGDKGDKGDTGGTGAVGPQGPSGAGNLTQCVVRFAQSDGTAIGDVKQVTEVIEETGKKILHYSCSSNNADIVQRDYRFHDNKNKYSCWCLGQGTYSYARSPPSKPTKMYCYITYTECPLIS
ncbi:macrophage scavenger receptor types I and II [Exaiptasia diaphana]|uniref:Uncharacterized protein n=1 Tax=Exaiptasia diaphana TaxID=2652724 RepID=A0A913XTA3_EXADI|nr:macrophage scavenger receptor types I and II [Exaiptasia diaphana]